MSSIASAPYTKCWTCPECFETHPYQVERCEGCGIDLSCRIERQPVPVCNTLPAPRRPVPHSQRIDLSTVPSAMETRAAGWAKPKEIDQ